MFMQNQVMHQRCLPDIPKGSKTHAKIRINHVKRRSISTGVSGMRPAIRQDQSVHVPSNTTHGVYEGIRPIKR